MAELISEIEHDVSAAVRVGEVLARGAWDYALEHPGEIVKTAAITVGTGVLVGGAMALFPESVIVGAVVGIGGGVLGAAGLTSMGLQTYHGFKEAWPDLEIVADGDHYTKAQVAAAEKAVEEKTGAVVANAALLVPGIVAGSIAGNLGADLIVAAQGTDVLAAAAAGTVGAAAADAVCPLAEVETAAAVAEESAACGCRTAALVETDPIMALWNFLKYNPLDQIPKPNFWMRLNNSDAFTVESNYWLAKADIDALKLISTGTSEVPREIPPFDPIQKRKES